MNGQKGYFGRSIVHKKGEALRSSDGTEYERGLRTSSSRAPPEPPVEEALRDYAFVLMISIFPAG
jgi:hypothetical protein